MKEEDWSLIFALEGAEDARSVNITRCIWTITLSKCRVILKSMYTNVALCETHKISYREWKEEDWSVRIAREGAWWPLRIAREGAEDVRLHIITRCIWTITSSKCRVMLKSMYTNVALCETHKKSYREWKEADWSAKNCT